MGAQAGDRRRDHRAPVGAGADTAGEGRAQRGVLRLLHQGQDLGYLGIAGHLEEGRLGEVDLEHASDHVVEGRVAAEVLQVGKDDARSPGKQVRPHPSGDRQGQDPETQDGGRACSPDP